LHVTLATVYAMPASELNQWQAYYSIYPFTFDRADVYHAELLAAILNDGRATRAQAAGRRNVETIRTSELIPQYITPEVRVHDPKQRAQYQAFKAQLQVAKERNGLRDSIPTPDIG
jgi:hypothetical protein